MTDRTAYDAAYKALNSEQKLAVDTIEGPVFVIAGPGTGKTQVLTLRIANILLTTDTPPESILALTFTESAAAEMRERLAKIVGSTAWKVRMHTFHSFAQSLTSRYPDQFPRIVGAEIASDAERIEILQDALLSSEVKHLRPYGDPLYYYRHANSAIQTLKRENVTPDALEERIREEEEAFERIPDKVHTKGKYEGKMKGEFEGLKKKIEKTADLLQVYRAYEAGLTARRRYDFDDLILEVVSALEEDETFRQQVQESLLYILADEHQDANRAQNALLELVSDFHERPNIFIVGDEKQAIYRFQGADLDNVHYFRERYTDTKVIALVENYRSTQSILDSALALIAKSPDTRLSRVPLVANAPHTARPISVVTCPSPESEMAELAARIGETMTEGIAPGDIAVLVRRNKDVAVVAEELAKRGIAVAAAGEGNALHNRYVLALLRLLTAVATPRDENLVGVLTLPAFPLSAADTWRVMQHAKKERMPAIEVLRSSEQLKEAKVANVEQAQALGSLIESLARTASIERPAVVAEEALRRSGLLPHILAAPDRAESLGAMRSLLSLFEDLARREHGAQLPRALELIDLYEEREMSLSGRVFADETRVKVMTAHKSKGREFRRVFIPMATEGAWSTKARPEHFHLPDILSGSVELEDERRLLYVAITRAKEHATISYSTTRGEDRAEEPSALLEDLDPVLISPETGTSAIDDPLTSEHLVREDGKPSEDDLATLRAAFLSQGLSPTALNNYLGCPWHYFYVNLLRIPEAENKYMLYGTAIHAALKRYADARNLGEDIGTEGMLGVFMRAIDRSPLTEGELDELKEKGTRALTNWWNEKHASWPERTEAEVGVEAYLDLEGERLLLRGALDRMDPMPGGYRVIDYKTGKGKSRNEIMGATKESSGDYYRQLTCYKLMLARTEQPRTMTEGVIEFVEPDDKGRIRTEAFEITDTEVAELEALIRKTAGEILSLSFWNDPCDDEGCAWCAMRFSR